jgi:hypothetical protein
MTDDEIQATIDRRLDEVEARLPPRTLDPATSSRPMGGRPIAVRVGGGAWPGLQVVAVMAVVIGLGVVGRRGGAPPGVAEGSASAPASSLSPSAPPVATQRPTATPPYETSFVDGLEVLRGEMGASELISIRLGWSVVGACFRVADVLRRGPDGIAIDAAAEAAGIDEGWLDVPGTGRVYIGPSTNRAALALGATILAYGGRGDTAVLLRDAAVELVGWPTIGGNTVWLTMDSTRRVPCPPEVDGSPAP